MCGISGIISYDLGHHDLFKLSAKSLLMHRGPDNFGFATFHSLGITLAHNRLSIVDDNVASNQPFGNKTGSLVFNGEIYNYKSLRASLMERFSSKNDFVTDSDTEVLFKGISLLGPSFLSEIDGMYSVAYLDLKSGSLYLFADSFGVKQIYYCLHKGILIFGSEFEFVSTVAKQIGFALTPQPTAFDYCYSYLSPPVGHTLFSEIKRLLPGSLHKYLINQPGLTSEPAVSSYSCLGHFSLGSKSLSHDIYSESILSELRKGMTSYAKQGILCSGGIDSTVIAMAADRESPNGSKIPLILASYSPSNEGFVSDAPYAERVGKTLQHPMIRLFMPSLSKDVFKELSDKMTCCGDISAALPLFKLSREATGFGVRVLFTGLGADEIFLGYRQHQLLSIHSFLPCKARIVFSSILSCVANVRLLPSNVRRKLRQASAGLSLNPFDSTIRSMQWGSPSGDVSASFRSAMLVAFDLLELPKLSLLDKAKLLFFLHFLASTHLPPSDSVSMNASVELRPIFLTKSILHRYLKKFSLWTALFPKLSLKAVVMSRFSPAFVFRPKTGFGIEASQIDPDLLAFLLESIEQSSLILPGLRDRVASDLKPESLGASCRPLYGLLSLVHSLRIADRILSVR